MDNVDILGFGMILLMCGVVAAIIGVIVYENRAYRAAYVAWGISAFFLITVLSRVWWNFVTN